MSRPSPAPELARRWPYFAIAAAVLVADQATKILAHAYLRERPRIELVPGLFNLIYSRNAGGLFGYFSGLGAPWRTLLLTLLPLVAVGLIGYFLVRSQDVDRPTLAGLGLILGGAVGNLLDRMIRGEVVDFFDVYASHEGFASWLIETFGTAHWPTFNVADSAIVVGSALLMLNSVGPQVAHPASAAEGKSRG